MNEPDSENNLSLVPYPSQELAVPQGAENRILTEMIESSLALARESDTRNSKKQQPSQEGLLREQKAMPDSAPRETRAKTFLRFISRIVSPTSKLNAHLDLDALVREGRRLWCGEGMTAGDIQAFGLFLSAAEGGHSEAQFLVSNCYDWGNGVQRDEAQALDWLRKSAKSGFAEAEHWFGYCYFSGDGVPQDFEIALRWYRKAAEQGNAGAQCSLALCYRCGDGVPEDETEAAKWYRKAAEQGNAEAQDNLGRCYQCGDGVPEDETEAAKWYRKAAEQGDAGAQSSLGYCYSEGTGVPVDILQAYKWFRLAADQGRNSATEEATALAALMSPSEFKAADALYREFQDKHAAKL